MRTPAFLFLAALAVPVAGCATTQADLRQQEALNNACRMPEMPGTMKCVMDKSGCACSNFDVLNTSLGMNTETEWFSFIPTSVSHAAR